MRPGRLWVAAVVTAGVAAAQTALACPGHNVEQGSPWAGLVVLLGILVGVPAVMFQLVAPSPLAGAAAGKLLRLRVWGAMLGALLLVGLAWKERRAWLHRVRETLRQNVILDGRHPVWKQWARASPASFHRVYQLSAVFAVTTVVLMWVTTLLDPNSTWGQGPEIVLSFGADTVLTAVLSYFLFQRVGFHLAAGLFEGGVVARTLKTLARALLLGGAAGLFGGAVFGLNCGVQTMFLVENAQPDWMPFIVGYYSMNCFFLGAMACMSFALAIMWPGRREPLLLRP